MPDPINPAIPAPSPAPVVPEADPAVPVDETPEQLEAEMLKDMGVDPEPPKKESDEEKDENAQAAAAEPTQPAAEGGGDDTVPAGESADAAAPAAVAPVVEQPAKPAPQITIQPDAMDAKFDDAIAKINADDNLTDSVKAAEVLKLEVQREDRNERRLEQAKAKHESDWNAAASHHGIPRATLEAEWSNMQRKMYAKGYRGDALYGAAYEALEAKVAEIKSAAKPAAPASPPPASKGGKVAPPTAKTPISPVGARVVPPGAGSVPNPPKPMTDEEELVATQRKNVPGGLRSMVG